MTRGRTAETPGSIPRAGWLDIATRVWNRMGAIHVGLLAAGVAFYGLLSLFPAITASVAVLGLIFEPARILELSQWLLATLPEAAGELIEGQLTEVSAAGNGSLGLAALLSTAIALWSASKAMDSLVQGMNVIYEEEDQRGFVKTKLVTLGLTFSLILGLGILFAIIAAVPAVLSFFGATEGWTDAALLLRWPAAFLIGVIGISLLYRYGPDRRLAKWRWITPGAALGCTLWVAGTFGFSAYVQSFGSYNETFGTLAGVIVLLTWMWLSAYVLFLGAELDAEMEAQTRRDSTVGPDRPMGRRGAQKADTLGPARGEDTESEEPSSLVAR